jgi:hypothetical protein
MNRDSDGTRSAETACPAPAPKGCQARAEGIAQVCQSLITQQLERLSPLLRMGEMVREFKAEDEANGIIWAGNSGSREPNPQAVSALTGFDPGREEEQ